MLSLPQVQKCARTLNVLDIRRPHTFVCMARILKWFQTRFQRRTVSRFGLRQQTTRRFACCRYRRPFFKVSKGAARPPDPACVGVLASQHSNVTTPRVRLRFFLEVVRELPHHGNESLARHRERAVAPIGKAEFPPQFRTFHPDQFHSACGHVIARKSCADE